MTAIALNFSGTDGWDDWDDWAGNSNNNNNGNGSGSGQEIQPRGNQYPEPEPENTWGTRPTSRGGGGGYPPVQNYDNDPDVYLIRAISEIPFRGMSGFQKLFSGKPIYANNQYNLSLQRSGNVGHGGGQINGVIFGKIENQALNYGMKVRVKGHNKRGLLIIDRMYDVDGGNQEIYINHFWRDPLDQGGRPGPVAGGGLFMILFLIVAVLALLMAVFHLFGGGLDPALVGKIKLIAAIIAILFFIKVFNINIFNNSFVQKVILFVVLVAIALYVPGGDSVMVAAITLYGLYLIIRSITR